MKTLLLFFCLSYFSLSFAADAGKNLNQVQGKINTASSKLQQLKKKQQRASKKLKQIEGKYGRISRSLRQVKTKIAKYEQRLGEIQQDSHLQTMALKEQQKALAEQVKSAYLLGQEAPLKLLLSQESISRTSRMLRYYGYYNRQRLEQVQQINNTLKLLAYLEQEKQKEITGITPLLREKKQQQQQLSKTKSARKRVLRTLKRQSNSQQKKLTRLKNNAKQLKKVIRDLQAKKVAESKRKANVFLQLKGKLSWPVKGKMIQSFGSRRLESKWNGVLIQAKEGVKVKAIAAGEVVFSKWMKGYGLLIIVQHDKDYMTLYAFNQSLYKVKGDSVAQGETLATLGHSGGRDIPALYFEIREKGRAINPAQWCK